MTTPRMNQPIEYMAKPMEYKEEVASVPPVELVTVNDKKKWVQPKAVNLYTMMLHHRHQIMMFWK